MTSFMVLLASCTLGAGVFFLRGLGSNEHVSSNLLTISLVLFVDGAG